MSDSEDEFTVQSVKAHMKFDALVERALDGRAKFSPSSIDEEKKEHSKYAYLVHWQGFALEDRTWEPEANLLNNVKLAEYKREKGLPERHEMFEKLYSTSTWRRLSFPQVNSTRYLMTKQEKEAERLAKAKKNERLEELNRSSLNEKSKPRERILTPEDTEEIMKKKRKDRELGTSSEGAKVSASTAGNASNSNENNNVSEEKKRKEALPGIKPLDMNTPRIQKKSTEINPMQSSSLGGSSSSAALSALSTRSNFQTQISTGSSSPSTSNPPLKITVKKGAGGEYETIPSKVQLERANSDISLISIASSSHDSDIIVIDDKKDAELTLKKRIDKANMELSRIKTDLKKYPVRVEGARVLRGFPYALNLRKFRRCQSEGMLNDSFNKNADLEIFTKNFESAVLMRNKQPPPVIKVLPEVPFLIDTKPIATQKNLSTVYEDLAKDNVEKIKQAAKEMRSNKHFLKVLELLAIAYSNDDEVRFKQIFQKGISDRKLDGHSFAAIVFIICKCNHRLWDADPKGMKLFQADGCVKWGNIRKQEVICCQNHRKCSWMRVFLDLIPEKLRFIETSGRCLHGWQGDDGPFRDDIFFHCMRNGAECQKRLFFEYNKPIGLQEELSGEYSLDAMHFLSVQYGNLQRIASYISLGGFDINALATHIPTQRVIRLQEYLKIWIKENVTKSEVATDEHKEYYKHLQSMVRLICESLDTFVEAEFKRTLLSRMDGRWKIFMNLTYPHILRCSPHNSESRDGDGNQVLSCLYYPEAAGYRDGLESTFEKEDEENREKLNSNRKRFEKLVGEKKGRLILVLYRVDINFEANVPRKFALPKFELVKSNNGFTIRKMTLLRQIESDDPETVDIGLIEMTPLSTPGCRYFCIENAEQEKRLIVPGSAHIELKGEFSRSMSFATQVFFLKKNS